MSSPTPCVPTSCCSTPTTVSVPGSTGASGITTASSFVLPAIGATVAITVGDSSWIKQGKNLFISDGSKLANFVVTGVNSATSITARFLGLVGDSASGTFSDGAVVSPGFGNQTVAWDLDAMAALTDNSTGSAGNTIAAGVGISYLKFPHTFIGGTAAVEPVTAFTVGYKFKILSWVFVTEVLLVGAAGSRVANMEINSTDVGIVPSTVTIPIANAAVGTVTAGLAVSGANTGTNTDTFSIEIQNGGTQFTAGSGTFIVTVQNMDTADAIASLASKINTLRTALRHQ